MDSIKTCLTLMQGKVFKLLPMREDRDSGIDNNLVDYITNLLALFGGSMVNYPELKSNATYIAVYNNVAMLSTNIGCDMKQWRSVVLRSVRLIGDVIKYVELARFIHG